ncbi:MAG: 5-formyltetrahydrofolate cyclo-ligase [Lachnospiraceae bacterium]|nr:5-formyltetrahydrofolate cyclo-ligase [Candidatus Equihabitans merdae]
MKKALRREFLNMRRNMTSEEIREKSTRISRTLFGYLSGTSFDTILLYASYGGEVDTSFIFEEAVKQGKLVAYPKVTGKDMAFFMVKDKDDLLAGYKGILEPSDHCSMVGEDQLSRALLLMPGIVFDRNGNRIGQGGGFYDRFLARYPHIKRAALAYDYQVLDQMLPTEEHDCNTSVIITESEVIETE